MTTRLLALISVLLIGVTACAAGQLFAGSTPTLAPTLTPSPSVPPLYQQVDFTLDTTGESSQAPLYTITAKTPLLRGSDDPRVQKFNQETRALVQDEIAQFKHWTVGLPAVPITGGSSLDVSFEILAPPGDLLSLKFDLYSYIDGAAYPGTVSRTLTYDLEQGADVGLEQLFLPGSGYLQTIADYCKAELARRDIAFDPSLTTGADPTPENYRSWNITPDGLLVTFDEYQVAAYAAGPQLVTVPYVQLQAVIDPQGPLGAFK